MLDLPSAQAAARYLPSGEKARAKQPLFPQGMLIECLSGITQGSRRFLPLLAIIRIELEASVLDFVGI